LIAGRLPREDGRESTTSLDDRAPYLDPSLIGPLYQRVEGVEARSMAAARIYYQLRETDLAAAERYRRDAGIGEERDVGTIVVN